MCPLLLIALSYRGLFWRLEFLPLLWSVPTCLSSPSTQPCSSTSWPSISDAGTIHGPMGQKESQLFPRNHCEPERDGME